MHHLSWELIKIWRGFWNMGTKNYLKSWKEQEIFRKTLLGYCSWVQKPPWKSVKKKLRKRGFDTMLEIVKWHYGSPTGDKNQNPLARPKQQENKPIRKMLYVLQKNWVYRAVWRITILRDFYTKLKGTW